MNAGRGHIERGRSGVHGPMRCVVMFMLWWCKVSNKPSDDDRLGATISKLLLLTSERRGR